MLNINYVKSAFNTTPEDVYEENATFFESAFDEIGYADKKLAYEQEFGNATSDDFEAYTESVSSALDSVGKKIIEIIERVRKFVTDQITKVKEIAWKNKDTEAKIEKLLKSRPDIDISKAGTFEAREYKININDFKDLSTFIKECDAVMAAIEKGKVDPDSLKGRIDKAKQKLDDASETIIKIGKVAGAVTAIVGVAAAFRKYKKDNEKSMEQLVDAASKESHKIEESLQAINRIAANNPDELANIRRQQTVLAYLANQYESATTGTIKKRSQANFHINREMDRFLNWLHRGADANERRLNAINNTTRDLTERRGTVNRTLDNLNHRIHENNAAQRNR